MDPTLRRRRRITVIYVLALTVASLVPGGAAGLAGPGPFGLVGLDKWVHAIGYAVLAWLAAASVADGWRRTLLVAALAVGLGGGIELAQSVVPGRMTEVGDLLADAVGVAVGLATDRLLAARRRG